MLYYRYELETHLFTPIRVVQASHQARLSNRNRIATHSTSVVPRSANKRTTKCCCFLLFFPPRVTSPAFRILRSSRIGRLKCCFRDRRERNARVGTPYNTATLGSVCHIHTIITTVFIRVDLPTIVTLRHIDPLRCLCSDSGGGDNDGDSCYPTADSRHLGVNRAGQTDRSRAGNSQPVTQSTSGSPAG